MIQQFWSQFQSTCDVTPPQEKKKKKNLRHTDLEKCTNRVF